MKKLRRQYLNTMNVIDKYIMQGYQDLKLHKAIEMNDNIALFKKHQVGDYKGYIESCLELEYIV